MWIKNNKTTSKQLRVLFMKLKHIYIFGKRHHFILLCNFPKQGKLLSSLIMPLMLSLGRWQTGISHTNKCHTLFFLEAEGDTLENQFLTNNKNFIFFAALQLMYLRAFCFFVPESQGCPFGSLLFSFSKYFYQQVTYLCISIFSDVRSPLHPCFFTLSGWFISGDWSRRAQHNHKCYSA